MSRRTACVFIGFLVAGSLVLRWFGLGFQLPHYVPVDSLVLASEVEVLRHHGDPSYRLRPSLYPRLIPVLALLLPAEGPEDPPPRTLEAHLERARAPYLRICIVVALLSVIAVPGTYLLARRFLDRPWAVLAAALVGTSVLHLWFSQEGRPHSAAMSMILLAVLASLRLRRKPVASSYVLVGIALGAAVATLQSGVATLLPFVAAFLLRSRRALRSSPWLVVLSILLLVAAMWAFYPSMGGTSDTWGPASRMPLAIHGSTIFLMGHVIHLQYFNGEGVPVLVGSLWAYDPLIAVMASLGAVLGLAAMWQKRRSPSPERASRAIPEDLLVVLSYAVPYAIVIGLYYFSTQRFVLPLLPFLACLGAYALRSAWVFCRAHGRWPRTAAAAGIVAILAVQTFAATKLSWIRSRPDTATEAASWIRTHLRPGVDRILVSPGFELPLLQTPDALERNKPISANPNERWFAYQISAVCRSDTTSDRYELITLPIAETEARDRALADPARFIRDLDADWIVIEVHRTHDWGGLLRLREALGEVGELVVTFSPDRVRRWGDVPIAHQGFDPRPFPVPWFLRILDARCTGMVLEVWKLRK